MNYIVKTLSGEGFVIRFYRGFSDQIDNVRTVETEEVSIHTVTTLPDTVMHNLRWMIPMALDEKLDFRKAVRVFEAQVRPCRTCGKLDN